MNNAAGHDYGAFMANLPVVSVHFEYTEPSYTQTRRAAGNLQRADWPIKSFTAYKNAAVEGNAFRGFHEYMTESKGNTKATGDKAVLDLLRLTHFFTFDGAHLTTQEDFAKPSWVIAMFAQEQHIAFMKHDVMDFDKYTWPESTMRSVKHYLDYLGTELHRARSVGADVAHLDKFISTVEQAKTYFREGPTRSANKARSRRLAFRATKDYRRYAALPPRSQMRLAIRRGQLELIEASRRCRVERRPLAVGEMNVATSNMVGIIFLDGFAGRPGEWQSLALSKIDQFRASSESYFTVNEHKTARVYGELAKYIAPSVRAAIDCYASLPRPIAAYAAQDDAAADLFLINGIGGAIRISERLEVFQVRHFGHTGSEGSETPKITPTLLRKAFHSTLMRLTSTEDRVLDILEILDGHRKSTALRHYVLRDPSHDAKLARQLTEAVFGASVPWPGVAELPTASDGEMLPITLPTADESGVEHSFVELGEAELEAPPVHQNTLSHAIVAKSETL